jgi:hypothetical protein
MTNQLKSCVYFFPTNIKSPNKQLNKRFNNLLVQNSFWVNNELTNIQRLYKIQNYKNHFYIPENTNKIHIAEYQEHHGRITDGDILGNDDSILFKFENAQLIYFKDYLKTSPQEFILRVIDSFETLTQSVCILNDLHIVHNFLKSDTILYDIQHGNLVLCNFRFSIDMRHKNKETYLIHFFSEFDPEYNERPLEIHLLSFMITNKLKSLSINNIEFVINSVAKHSIIHNFNSTIISEFVSSSMKYFEKYVNKSYEEILHDILKHSNTWDIYALSLMYLDILSSLYNKLTNTNKQNKFIILFMKLLVNNLHFHPEKRHSPQITLTYFKIMLESIGPSSYIEIIQDLMAS